MINFLKYLFGIEIKPFNFEKDLRNKIQNVIKNDYDGLYVGAILYGEAAEKLQAEMSYLRVTKCYTVEGSILVIKIHEKDRVPANKMIDYAS